MTRHHDNDQEVLDERSFELTPLTGSRQSPPPAHLGESPWRGIRLLGGPSAPEACRFSGRTRSRAQWSSIDSSWSQPGCDDKFPVRFYINHLSGSGVSGTILECNTGGDLMGNSWLTPSQRLSITMERLLLLTVKRCCCAPIIQRRFK